MNNNSNNKLNNFNDDLLLEFFYKIISDDLIFEKIKIENFCNDKIIKNKDIILKNTKQSLVILEIQLENNKILLVEDFITNFLLSYTILIGEQTKIVEFKTKNNKIYICLEEIFEKIKNKYTLLENKKTYIKPKELFELKFNLNYRIPNIIEDLKKYVLDNKKLDLNKIHIMKGDKIENFVPTIKNTHFKIAKLMSLPIISLIKNNFIKTTDINVHDILTQKEIIKPIFETQITIKREFNKLDNLLYKDISKDFHIKFNIKNLINKIINCKLNSLKKKDLINKISNLKPIKLTNKNGNIQTPLWKCEKSLKLLKIKNSLEFENLSGIKWENSKNNLDDIYLQNEIGEVGIYQNKFLDKHIKNILENIKGLNEIEYDSINELAIKLFLSKNPLMIIKNEKINEININNLIENISKLIDLIVIIKTNMNKKIENKKIQIYLESLFVEFNSELENYDENLSKKQLLKNIGNNLNYLVINIKKIDNNFKINSNLLISICDLLLKISNIIDEEKTKNLKIKFDSYLKNVKKNLENNNINNFYFDKEIINLFNDLGFIYNYSKINNLFIIFKQKLNSNFTKNIRKLNNITKYDEFIKPNYKILKKIFPYSYNEVSSKIKLFDYRNIRNSNLIIKGKIIKIKPEFYKFIKIYKNYKILKDNKYFTLLIKR